MKSGDWSRPKTLAEVSEGSASENEFFGHLRDFLHEFQRSPSARMIVEEPGPMRERFEFGAIADCYLAAVAVELSLTLGCIRPAWTHRPERFVREPWFAGTSAKLRTCLLHESPAGFRERNLFVSENALSVA
jgi:hypothetical protein